MTDERPSPAKILYQRLAAIQLMAGWLVLLLSVLLLPLGGWPMVMLCACLATGHFAGSALLCCAARWLALAALLSLPLTTHAAPLPRGKPAVRQPAQLVPGTYDMTWHGTDWRTTIKATGAYESRLDTIVYRGFWSYCPRLHEVTITEKLCTKDSECPWTTWTQKLDKHLAGDAVFAGGVTKVPVKWKAVRQ